MKIKTIAAAIAVMLVASSCGTMMPGAQSAPQSSSSSSASTGDILGSLLGSIVGNAMPLSQQTILGTWNYSSPECRFESENFLMQAGGEIGAANIEKKLENVYSMLGIKKGTCSFTFNQDGTCQIQLGRIPVSGTYTLDTKAREINISAANGLVNLKSNVYYTPGNLTLLFDADRLLTIAQAIARFTGQGNQAMSTVSSLADSYNGMKIGFNLTK